jgi:hypothetical protein
LKVTPPKPFRIPERKPQKKMDLWQTLKAQIQTEKISTGFTNEDFDETAMDFWEEENDWNEFLTTEEEWA